MDVCRLARLAINIGTPFVRLLCFPLWRCPRLFVECVCRAYRLACLLFNNECELLPFVLSLQTFQIPFPVCSFVGWFGWLLPVVLSHRHTAKSFSFAVVTCQVYPVHAERRTADPIDHYCTATAVAYCCAGRTLNPIDCLCVPFSRAAALICASVHGSHSVRRLCPFSF